MQRTLPVRYVLELLRLPAEASLAPPLLLVAQELAAVAFSGGGPLAGYSTTREALPQSKP